MNALQNACLALLVVFGVLIHTAAGDKAIQKDTIKIYKNILKDDYGRHDILGYYKSKCHWEDKIEYINCLRKTANSFNLGDTIQPTDNVRDVCCFFWNALDCAKTHTKCKAMFDIMLGHFLEHQLKDQCKAHPRESDHFDQCKISEETKDKANYVSVSKDEEPFMYIIRKEMQNILRKTIP